MRLGILGGNGFIGKKIVEYFESKDWEIHIFSRRILQSPRNHHFVDLFDAESLRKAILKCKPDLVINAAWDTTPGHFWNNFNNFEYDCASTNFAEICFQNGVGKFIGLGSVSEYGDSPGYCDAKTTPVVSTSNYAKAKIKSGQSLLKLGEKYGTRTHWMRIFQAFGEDEKSERLIPMLIRNLQNKNDFELKTPYSILDWIDTNDIASAIYFAQINLSNHYIDIGTGKGTSVIDFAHIICQQLNLDPDLIKYPTKNSSISKFAIVDSKSDLLVKGWKAEHSLEFRTKNLSKKSKYPC